MDRPTASQRAAIRHRESSKYAPSYGLPHHALISIEHPFIIRNIDKGIQTLGGLQKMKAVCLAAFRGGLDLTCAGVSARENPVRTCSIIFASG